MPRRLPLKFALAFSLGPGLSANGHTQDSSHIAGPRTESGPVNSGYRHFCCSWPPACLCLLIAAV